MTWSSWLAFVGSAAYMGCALAATAFFLRQVPWRAMILRPGQNEIDVGLGVAWSIALALLSALFWPAWPVLYVVGAVARKLAL